MKTTSKWFILVSVIWIAILGGIYYIGVNQYFIKDWEIPRSYKQYLLQLSKESREKIVLVGGSDVHHGINAMQLEDYYGVPVINLGDNGGYPLNHKIMNVEKYVNEGDTVIFSLVWAHYFEGEYYGGKYAESIIDKQNSNSFYYTNLNVLENIKFIFGGMPYKIVFSEAFNRPTNIERYNYQLSRWTAFDRRVRSRKSSARGGSDREGPEKIANDGTSEITCDQYVFGDHFQNLIKSLQKDNDIQIPPKIFRQVELANRNYLGKAIRIAETSGRSIDLSNAEPSDIFLKNIRLMDVLKKKGVRVVMAWPIVVDHSGNNCYKTSNSRGLEQFAASLRALLHKQGIEYLGNYQQFRYGEGCFLNTYAHIRQSCARKNTQSLINEIDRMHIVARKPIAAENPFTRKIILSLEKSRQKLLERIDRGDLPELPGTRITASNLKKYMVFREGWSDEEDWGIWSSGHKSMITMKIPDKRSINGIHLEGQYFNGNENTAVKVNGRKIGEFDLINRIIPIPAGSIRESRTIDIELVHKNPLSPLELNSRDTDDRKIKYGLRAISTVEPVGRTRKIIRKENLPDLSEDWIDGRKLELNALLMDGWYSSEEWGHWSKGRTSRIILKIDRSSQRKVIINLEGRYFNGEEQTGVYINQKYMGKHNLTNAEFSLSPEQVGESGYIEFVLEHSAPIQPVKIDRNSKDNRVIKYGLEKIRVQQG